MHFFVFVLIITKIKSDDHRLQNVVDKLLHEQQLEAQEHLSDGDMKRVQNFESFNRSAEAYVTSEKI